MRALAIIGGIGFVTAAGGAAEPAAYWRFEEAGGTTVIDSGPNGLDGTLNALPFRIADVAVDPVPGTGEANAQSLDLNWQNTTSGGRFNVVDPGGRLSFGNASFTIEAWVRLDHVSDTSGASQRQYLCQKKPNTGQDAQLDYAFLAQAGDLGSTGRELALRFGDGATAMTQVGTLEISDTEWHHVSLAYDADAGELRFGVDGAFETIAFAKPNHTNTGPLRVGAHQNTAGEHNHFLRGTIDEMRIAEGFVPVDLLLDTPGADCNDNGTPDVTDIANGTSSDCNGNCVPDECDIESGASEDCQADGIPDDCQLAEFRYAHEDGEGDAAVRSEGTRMAWLSHHVVADGADTITHLDIAFFDSGGKPATAYIWSDPNGDGDPTDATVVMAHPFTIADDVGDLNEASLIDVPDTFVGPVGTSFFLGVILDFEVTGDDFPARYDLDDPSVPGVDWVIGHVAPIDPNDLSDGAVEFALVENAGLPPGNWTMQGVRGAGDCDGNGVPDVCDFENGAVDCNENGILDDCELGLNDCNLNGIPDDCDIANGTSEDVDMDGVPDECPLPAICVPDDSPTIQGAILVAGPGTVITVKDGTYLETVNFKGKAITIVSENGPATTTIDAGGAGGSAVVFKTGEGPDSILEGFTVTGGLADSIGGGGGIVVTDASPTIRGNVITGNGTADTFGGGLVIFQNCSPLIEGNVISDNIALGGGAIWAELDNSEVRLIDNQIVGNTANGDWASGVLILNGSVQCIGNEFADNTGGEIGGGLVVLLSGGSPSVIASNVFRNNQATDDGGGAYIDTFNPLVVNNLIVGNTAQRGGGIFADDTAVYANNTIIGNTATSQGGGFFDDGGPFTIVNSIVRGNSSPSGPQIEPGASLTVTYSNVEDGWPGTGNIDADPLFVDAPGGDYSLSAGSPSADAGSNSALPDDAGDLDGDGDVDEPTPLDIDGRPRRTDDPDAPDSGEGDPPIVDMGAYERLPCAADVDGSGTVDVSDLVAVILAWGSSDPAADVDGSGLVDVSDLVALILAWGPC